MPTYSFLSDKAFSVSSTAAWRARATGGAIQTLQVQMLRRSPWLQTAALVLIRMTQCHNFLHRLTGARVDYIVFFRPLSLCSWNARALFAYISSASLRASSRFCHAEKLLDRYQVACFQEARGSGADLAILRDELRT
eukprot:491073-Pyramimonas_sp.AAC.1